jgi:putative membrane protein
MAATRAQRLLAKLGGLAAAAAVLGAQAPTVQAHEGQPPAPHDLWRAWNLEPAILLPLGLTAWVYARGLRARRLSPPSLSFAAGLLFLAAALVSPIDALGSALFSGHMLQHMLLILLAAPLLVLGAPMGPLLLGLPRAVQLRLGRAWQAAPWLRPAGHALAQPLVAWSLHALVFWAWHAPALYQAALRSDAVHALEHFSLLGSALLFWWTVAPARGARSGVPGLAVLLLFTMAIQSGLLGVLITFAPEPWYGAYRATTAAWGLSPLEDQQLAGAGMWVASGGAYLLAALGIFAAWLNRLEYAGLRD